MAGLFSSQRKKLRRQGRKHGRARTGTSGHAHARRARDAHPNPQKKRHGCSQAKARGTGKQQQQQTTTTIREAAFHGFSLHTTRSLGLCGLRSCSSPRAQHYLPRRRRRRSFCRCLGINRDLLACRCLGKLYIVVLQKALGDVFEAKDLN